MVQTDFSECSRGGWFSRRRGAGKREMEIFSNPERISSHTPRRARNPHHIRIPQPRGGLPYWTKQGRVLVSQALTEHSWIPLKTPATNFLPMTSPPSMNSEKPIKPSARSSEKRSSARKTSSSNSRFASLLPRRLLSERTVRSLQDEKDPTPHMLRLCSFLASTF